VAVISQQTIVAALLHPAYSLVYHLFLPVLLFLKVRRLCYQWRRFGLKGWRGRKLQFTNRQPQISGREDMDAQNYNFALNSSFRLKFLFFGRHFPTD